MEEYLKNIKTVCCQGIEGAYSHIASNLVFPEIKPVFVKNFEDVFEYVRDGVCEAGILPVENSSAGLVSGIIENLVKNNLFIIHAKTLNITHVLCASKDTPVNSIKTVYSHRQAILQCSAFLKALNADCIETANTAMSAKTASQNPGTGAICSRLAAEIYGLEIKKEDVCNNKYNRTRFIVISKENFISENAGITSLYFITENKSGSLYGVLKLFADFNVNLSSLHSIPLEEENWKYGFYADIEGGIKQDNIRQSINKLCEEISFVRVLGTYKSEK